MPEMNVSETVRDLTKSVQESSQAIVNSAVAAQERNVRYVESVLGNGTEVLKSHIESGRSLVEAVVEQGPTPQELFQTFANSAIAAQERNIQFVQSVFENGIQVLQAHADSNRALTQELIEQSRKQQEIFQTLISAAVQRYVNFFSAPFTYYKQVLDLAENTTRQGLETFQRVSQQGLETFGSATRQARESVVR